MRVTGYVVIFQCRWKTINERHYANPQLMYRQLLLTQVATYFVPLESVDNAPKIK